MKIVNTELEYSIEHHLATVDLGNNETLTFEVVTEKGEVYSFISKNADLWNSLTLDQKDEIEELIHSYKF